MYDELERAYGGRTRRGPSVLGWVLIGLLSFSALGVAGAVLAYRAVRTEVRELAGQLEAESGERVSATVADAVAGALRGIEPELLAATPAVGRAILSNLRSGEMDQEALENLVEGSLLVRTGEGDLRADLRGNEEGGSLVVRSPEGEVRVELVRVGEGGELLVRADGEAVRFGAGEAAEGAPSWVPRPDGMPDDARQAFSATSGRGLFGVATWETEGDAEGLVEAFRERLESEGFELRAEHSLRAHANRSASVVGRDDESERMVFLVASVEEGSTRVVLGWGGGVER